MKPVEKAVIADLTARILNTPQKAIPFSATLTKEQHALRLDMRKHVRMLMVIATESALRHIDSLQQRGVDILADHGKSMNIYTTPRDFITAYAEQMKFTIGQSYRNDRVCNRRIANYFKKM